MTIRLTKSPKDLQQILDLQNINHATAIDLATAQSQGFITVKHDLDILNRMHQASPHVVAIMNEQVVGYALAMTYDFSRAMPTLIGFFDQLDKANYHGRALKDIPYLVMGQVCVAKEARGLALVDQMYDYMEQVYSKDYELFVTEVAADNPRSLRVHERCGFMELFRHEDLGKEWVTVVKPWNS